MTKCLVYLRKRHEIAKETLALWFDASGRDFTYTAGQYVSITIPELRLLHPGEETKAFSIANAPNEEKLLLIAIRRGKNPFKRTLERMPIGSIVELRGPSGTFLLHRNEEIPAVFLAGGIGITPVRSIIEWATIKHLPQPIYLFYSNESRERIAFLKDFELWQRKNNNFRFIPTLTKRAPSSWTYERGRISAEMLSRHMGDARNALYYVSGGEPMVKELLAVLDSLGAKELQIKIEEFSGYMGL